MANLQNAQTAPYRLEQTRKQSAKGKPNFSNSNESHRGIYRAFPVVMANKSSLEAGDKIVLPSAALDHLARLRVTYPMQFSISNPSNHSRTHCGVMEFSAEDGVCYLPYWMMQNLLLESGHSVEILNVTLPKGTFVKFQPHTTAFTELHNPRVVLERALRNFSCLTKGDTIAIQHGDSTYYLDIVEVKPANAISIVETDVNVDFAPPKDYVEPVRPIRSSPSSSPITPSSVPTSNNDVNFVFHAGGDQSQEKFFDSTQHLKQEAKLGEEKKNDITSSASSASPSPPPANGKSDYFSKLGSGHKLTGRRSSGSSSTATSSSSGTSSSATSSTLGNRSPLAPASTGDSKQVTESKGQWDYIYSVDAKGVKKLIKRLPRATDSGGFKAFGGTGKTLK